MDILKQMEAGRQEGTERLSVQKWLNILEFAGCFRHWLQGTSITRKKLRAVSKIILNKPRKKCYLLRNKKIRFGCRSWCLGAGWYWSRAEWGSLQWVYVFHIRQKATLPPRLVQVTGESQWARFQIEYLTATHCLTFVILFGPWPLLCSVSAPSTDHSLQWVLSNCLLIQWLIVALAQITKVQRAGPCLSEGFKTHKRGHKVAICS